MEELINSLVNQLGVTPAQAQGGAAAIFKAAKERLGAQQFDDILGGLPGVQDLVAKAPNAGGGLLGGLASMAGKIGGPEMAQAAQLLSTFNALGMNKDTAMKFLPELLQFLESHGGKELVTKVRAALKL